MTDPAQMVVFTLDECRYGLPLSIVARAVRMVEITPLPRAPEIVLGAVNMEGRIVPVLNVRRRFRLPERRIGVSDQLLIARTRQRTVALAVDAVDGVADCAGLEPVAPAEIVPGLEYVTGVVKLADGMLFIHDLDGFLSLGEEETLAAAVGTGEEAVPGG